MALRSPTRSPYEYPEISLGSCTCRFVHCSAYGSGALEVDVAPPAPVVEQTTIREGYVYTPGYWRYEEPSRKHVWVKGDYVPERRGEHWVAHEWRENNGRYLFNEGHWERDKAQ